MQQERNGNPGISLVNIGISHKAGGEKHKALNAYTFVSARCNGRLLYIHLKTGTNQTVI